MLAVRAQAADVIHATIAMNDFDIHSPSVSPITAVIPTHVSAANGRLDVDLSRHPTAAIAIPNEIRIASPTAPCSYSV